MSGTEVILADSAYHGDVSAERPGGEGLVGSLSAASGLEVFANDRFAWSREAVNRCHEVGV